MGSSDIQNNNEKLVNLDFLDSIDSLRFLSTTEPPGATGAMTTTYVNKGKESMIGDLPIYTVGTSKTNAIIFAYDIYGFNMGRTREICDRFADNGYFVILPDFYRGNYRDKPNSTFATSDYPWTKVSTDLTAVYGYLETMGIQKWTVMGTCWGGWVVFEACAASSKVVSGVSFHPAMGLGAPLTPDQMADKVLSPQFVASSTGEPASMQAGGSVETLLKGKSFGAKNVFKSYNESHGFVPRGNLTVASTAAAVEDALTSAIAFVKSMDPPIITSSNRIAVYIGFIFAIMFILL